MVKYLFFIFGISIMSFSMETANFVIPFKKKLFSYTEDILPHMPADTKIAPETGAAVLEQLEQVGFDIENPEWMFEHAFNWACQNGDRQQNDLAILKRFIALHIHRSQDAELGAIKKNIIKDPELLRWVVISDVGSAVSDDCINKRWQLFIEKLILYAPVGQLSNHE